MNIFKKNKNQENKKGAGFTLIEVIVAIGIFSLVMTVAIGAVLSIVGANRKAQSIHNVINSFNLAIETMVRDMRTGYDYRCDGLASDCSNKESFTFTSTQLGDKDVTYTFEHDEPGSYGYITKEVQGESGAPRLTSPDVVIKNLSFNLVGVEKMTSPSQDYFQPKVLVIIQGEARIGGEVSKFNIQTLVTQRRIDI